MLERVAATAQASAPALRLSPLAEYGQLRLQQEHVSNSAAACLPPAACLFRDSAAVRLAPGAAVRIRSLERALFNGPPWCASLAASPLLMRGWQRRPKPGQATRFSACKRNSHARHSRLVSVQRRWAIKSHRFAAVQSDHHPPAVTYTAHAHPLSLRCRCSSWST